MERRKEARLSSDMPVTITLLGAEKRPAISGRVLDVSGSGLLLSVPLPIPVGSPVKVEGNDMLLLGEACRLQESRGGYYVALEIVHSLGSLTDLERLNRALIGEEKAPITSASYSR